MNEVQICSECGRKKGVHYRRLDNQAKLCPICAYKYARSLGNKRRKILKIFLRDWQWKHKKQIDKAIDITFILLGLTTLLYGLYKFIFVDFSIYGLFILALLTLTVLDDFL